MIKIVNENNKNNIIDPISYATFLKDRENFRKSGTKSGSEFNYFETPRQTYFKILFYFCNSNSDNEIGIDTGLLAPTWEIYKSNVTPNNNPYYNYNSAWAYLKLNGEDELADKLKSFVELLANINSNAPWTFTSISGLDQALERQAIGQNKEFKIEDERKKITIKCLPDSYDERIGTLLDLYREITWSWNEKRENIPANLRKFDMAVYLFSDPIKNIHTPEKGKEASLNSSSIYKTSSKYIEFHNCEIDYNSSKSPYSELSNAEGNQLEYSIDIFYDDAYECRWNEFLMKNVGDIIKTDTNNLINNEKELESRVHLISQIEPNNIPNYEGKYKNNRFYGYPEPTEQINGFIANAMNELIGAGKSYIDNKINSIVLGNLFTISPKHLSTQIRRGVDGHILSTVDAIDDYLEHANRNPKKKKDLGNLFKNKSTAKNI